jgi:hypothetical protein
VRQACVETLRCNRQLFEPFLDGSETWERYLERMSLPYTWGGELELQALARAYKYVALR